MKKRILFTLGILSFFAFIFANVNAHAETTPSTNPSVTETTEPSTSVETEVITTLPSVEKGNVTLNEQLLDFGNKFGASIMSLLTGIVGAGGLLLFAKRSITKLDTTLNSGIKLGDDERKKALEDLEKAKKIASEASARYEKNIAEFKELIPRMTEEFKALVKQYEGEMGALKNTVETLTKDFSTARELIAILISQNPEFAKSGLATKILEVLEGKEVTLNE